LTSVEDKAVSPFKRLDGSPLFDEPWQAQVLAIADALIERGILAPALWSQVLGEEVRGAFECGETDGVETYYLAALRALERVTASNCAIDAEAAARRRAEWEEAYEATPHGQPVTLKAR
jgi:hypothetical protein